MNKFIDLFCGIGGFRLALEKQGLQCVFSSDIDKHVQKVYFKNFKDMPKGDISEIPAKKIPKHDVLCAGFPCQSFSISGKRKGILDNRGRLFYEIIRIAEYHQPSILLLENVKNILSINNGGVIKTIENKLNEIGYNVFMHVLNASFFGIPQARKRVYFVCLRKDLNLSSNRPKETYIKIYLENVLDKEIDKNLFINRTDIKYTKDSKNIEYSLKLIRLGIINKGGQGERIYSPKVHAVTLSANGGGMGAKTGLYLINNKIRKLSINEYKKLMGFPKNHFVSDGVQGYRQLGNAVIPLMVEKIWSNIKK